MIHMEMAALAALAVMEVVPTAMVEFASTTSVAW
jgi:hypothetical protein